MAVPAQQELICIWHYLRETEYHKLLNRKTKPKPTHQNEKTEVEVACHCQEDLALCHVSLEVEADLWLLHGKPLEQHNFSREEVKLLHLQTQLQLHFFK